MSAKYITPTYLSWDTLLAKRGLLDKDLNTKNRLAFKRFLDECNKEVDLISSPFTSTRPFVQDTQEFIFAQTCKNISLRTLRQVQNMSAKYITPTYLSWDTLLAKRGLLDKDLNTKNRLAFKRFLDECNKEVDLISSPFTSTRPFVQDTQEFIFAQHFHSHSSAFLQ